MTSQCHSLSVLDICPRSLRFDFFKLLFLKNTRSFEAKFHMKPPWDVGMKMCSNVLGHMNKCSGPYMGKTFKNHFLRNQEADDLET